MSIRRDELIKKIALLQLDNIDNRLTYEEYKLFSIMLSDEGWYMDYDLAIGYLTKLYIHQIGNNSTVLDDYMCRFYRKKQRKIRYFIKKHNRTRYKIIKKALKAHRKGDFELSVPVFLTQIEGLFYDLTQKEVFSKGRGKDNTAKNWIDSKYHSKMDVRLALVESLKENNNITASFKEAVDYPNALNRNRILHGRDILYSCALNSFKAISLLFFIVTIVSDIEKK